MRITCPVWKDRISPVFDDATVLMLIDLEGSTESSRKTVELRDPASVRKALQLTDLGVDVLICEAISESLERLVTARGVRVIQCICGPVDEVIKAFIKGIKIDMLFPMPGTHGGKKSRRRRRNLSSRGGRTGGRYHEDRNILERTEKHE